MMKLTDTQMAILTAAAQHPERLAAPPAKLAPAPREAIRRSLLGKGLIEPVVLENADAALAWAIEDGPAHYRISDAGLVAISAEPAAVPDVTVQDGLQDPQVAPLAQPAVAEGPDTAKAAEAAKQPARGALHATGRRSLREAATAVLTAWDASQDRAGMEEAVAGLRAALAGKPARVAREPGAPRKPREGTKQQQVLGLLRRPEGATIAQICEATGWQPHTVRGFFAGLKKRQGIAVTAVERIRQVGPGKEGAKGSYSVYRIADAG